MRPRRSRSAIESVMGRSFHNTHHYLPSICRVGNLCDHIAMEELFVRAMPSGWRGGNSASGAMSVSQGVE